MVDITTEADTRPGGGRTPESAEKWNTKFNQMRTARLTFEKKWFTNLAFVAGRQYATWIPGDNVASVGRMIEPINPQKRVRIVINKTRRIMRKELAKINKEPVRGYVIPSNSDSNSQAASRAADQVADYLIDELSMPFVMKQADWWMLICGTSFLKDYYDPNLRFGMMQMPPQIDPQTGKPGAPVTVPAKGGPVLEVVSPLHIYVPNLDEPDIQKQEFVMHVAMKSPSWVKQRFGVDLGEGVSVTSNTLESKLMQVMGLSQTTEQKRAIEVREIWIKPNADYPEGALITCTHDTMLEVTEPYPYMHGKYPFTKRTYIENSIFYGISVVEDLIPLQVEYNRTRSQIIEDKNRMGRPQLAVEQGSIVGGTKTLQGAAGEVVEYRMGSTPPQPIQITGLPAYIIDHVNRISQEMMEIASQDNTDGNNIPSGVTAATAIAYLQENQDALIMDTLRDKELAWQDVLQRLLSYIGQYWEGQRLITVSGENASFESFLFGQSDLAGQTNWKAVVGSATPQSYSAKQAQIMELMKGGFVPVAEGLKYLELGDTARLYEDLQLDKREAEKENTRMRSGVYVRVELWQEHLEHIVCHDNVRKHEEYESWDENGKAMIKYHVALHMMQFIQEKAPQLMLQIQLPPEWQQPPMEGQVPPVPEAFELALRAAVHMLTLGSAPGAVGLGSPPPTASAGAPPNA